MDWKNFLARYWRTILFADAIVLLAIVFWFNWKVGLFFLLVGPCLVATWYYVPKWQVRQIRSLPPGAKTKTQAELEDRHRQTLTTAIGGSLVLISAIAAFLQLEQNSENSRNQLASAARESERTFQDQQFARGFDLLGKESIAAQVGGIRLIQTWAEKGVGDEKITRIQLLTEALAGFVIDKTKFKKGIGSEECPKFIPEKEESNEIGAAVKMALRVIIERNEGKPIVLDFKGLNLSRADLHGGDFSKSNFAFSILSEAKMDNAKFQGVNFYCADLFKAKLRNSVLSSEETDLRGALLQHADLQKAKMVSVKLIGAKLSHAEMQDADLSKADLSGVDLHRAIMTGTVIDDQTIVLNACIYEAIDVPPSMKKAVGGATLIYGDCIEAQASPHFTRLQRYR
jgi:uncharacterized protein YjbI with pentapeptide repeats